MSRSEVRRAQLVSTFGPGAMQIIRDGISVITSGLDHWFSSQQETLNDEKEFRIEEERLARRLGVNYFMMPPDWRIPGKEDSHNAGLKIPVMRFPQWHVCSTPSCHYLMKVTLHNQSRHIECPKCRDKRRFSLMHQVRFVTACDNGHLSDFPWNEWAHHCASPDCDGHHLHLRSSGSTSLSALRVYCDKCKTKPRSLEGTTQIDGDSSFLSKNLEAGNMFACKGHAPWLGNHHTSNCQKPLRAALRGAANIYFADMVSSLLLPVGENSNQELIDLISTTESIWDFVVQASRYCADDTRIANDLHADFLTLQDYSKDDINKALAAIRKQDEDAAEPDADNEVLYRFEERKRLLNVVERKQLRVEPISTNSYEPWFSEAFSNISLIHRLTETRALSGFYRLSAASNMERSERIAQLRKTPARENHLWLPACQVYGEGIYLELSEEQIQKWLTNSQPFIQKRITTLQKSMDASFRQFHQALTPEYVLLHTLAHLVINQLVFECGYSSASLRERLYFPDPEQKIQMAGILIYTAAGDSEGSMGGLVNMGRPGHLERIISKALDNARWCSSDPVCMEAADHGGQGPESLNLAACHACSLLPETSCEAFNCLLDRGLLIGNQDYTEGGYFSCLLT